MVLGAGASVGYGLPTGAQLTAWLTQWYDQGSVPGEFARLLGDDVGSFVEFSKRFRESGYYSVDSFLGKQSEAEARLVRVGTKAIAYHIAEKENPENFLRAGNGADWYRLLWNSLSSEAKHWTDLGQNNLQVITFNYDRSLEAYLFSRAKSTWDLTDEDAFKALELIPISHVYGALQPLGSSDAATTRRYGPIRSVDALDHAAGAIKLMYSARAETAVELHTAWFSFADQVIWLGFGFDLLNVDQLGYKSAIAPRFTWNGGSWEGRSLESYMMTRGISEARVSRIFERMGHVLGKPIPLARETGAIEIEQALLGWDCLH